MSTRNNPRRTPPAPSGSSINSNKKTTKSTTKLQHNDARKDSSKNNVSRLRGMNLPPPLPPKEVGEDFENSDLFWDTVAQQEGGLAETNDGGDKVKNGTPPRKSKPHGGSKSPKTPKSNRKQSAKKKAKNKNAKKQKARADEMGTLRSKYVQDMQKLKTPELPSATNDTTNGEASDSKESPEWTRKFNIRSKSGKGGPKPIYFSPTGLSSIASIPPTPGTINTISTINTLSAIKQSGVKSTHGITSINSLSSSHNSKKKSPRRNNKSNVSNDMDAIDESKASIRKPDPDGDDDESTDSAEKPDPEGDDNIQLIGGPDPDLSDDSSSDMKIQDDQDDMAISDGEANDLFPDEDDKKGADTNLLSKSPRLNSTSGISKDSSPSQEVGDDDNEPIGGPDSDGSDESSSDMKIEDDQDDKAVSDGEGDDLFPDEDDKAGAGTKSLTKSPLLNSASGGTKDSSPSQEVGDDDSEPIGDLDGAVNSSNDMMIQDDEDDKAISDVEGSDVSPDEEDKEGTGTKSLTKSPRVNSAPEDSSSPLLETSMRELSERFMDGDDDDDDDDGGDVNEQIEEDDDAKEKDEVTQPSSIRKSSLRKSSKNRKDRRAMNLSSTITPDDNRRKRRRVTYAETEGYPIGNRDYESISVSALKRDREENDEDTNLRRSKRTRFRPLAYWKNERPIYEAHNETGALGDAMGDMPIVSGIVKALPTPYKKRKVTVIDDGRGRKRKSRVEERESSPTTAQVVTPFDSSKLRKKFKINDGEMASIWDEANGEVYDQKIVCYEDNMVVSDLPLKSKRGKRESKVVCKAVQTFNVPSFHEIIPGWIAGKLIVPPRGIKDTEGVGLCSQIFNIGDCQPKSLEIAVADPELNEGKFESATAQRYLLSKGDMFQIPAGNIYRIENHSETHEVTMFWTIIRPIQAKSEE